MSLCSALVSCAAVVGSEFEFRVGAPVVPFSAVFTSARVSTPLEPASCIIWLATYEGVAVGLMVMGGDAAPLMAAFASMDDIALLKLVTPLVDVNPVPLYRGSNEKGMLVKIYGKGATGNGLVGEYKD